MLFANAPFFSVTYYDDKDSKHLHFLLFDFSPVKKQRHYFVNKGASSQGYGFSCSHVWMWELDYKESWALKNWCF